MTIHTVPAEVLDELTRLKAFVPQLEALEAERTACADECLESIKGLSQEWPAAVTHRVVTAFGAMYGSGWTKRLEAAGLPTPKQLKAKMLGECNDGDGRWRGPFPMETTDRRPPAGTWVVYQLIWKDELVYIGSTGSLATRLKAHARDKDFDSWRASRCDNESHCRALETALIDRHRPPLNRMIPTPKLVLR